MIPHFGVRGAYLNTASFFVLAFLVAPCAIADAAAPRDVAKKQIRAALAE
jgi:hypothetical protein